MQYHQYIANVQHEGMIESPEHAEQAITATLDVLGERLTGGKARSLAAQLPAELKDTLEQHSDEAEAFDVDEFLRRVANREGRGCTPERASEHARAVLSTIAGSVSAREVRDMRSQLPAGYAFLI